MSDSPIYVTVESSFPLVFGPYPESFPNRPLASLAHTHPMVIQAQNNIFCTKLLYVTTKHVIPLTL